MASTFRVNRNWYLLLEKQTLVALGMAAQLLSNILVKGLIQKD